MAKNKKNVWRTAVEIIIYVLLAAAWMIFWLISLFGSLPVNYVLSLVPLLFVLWKMTQQVPVKFVAGVTSLFFLFFIIFDYLNGTIPQQMTFAVKYNALAVYEQWGRCLLLIGVGNYVFDTIVDSLIGLLIVTFVWRIITIFRESFQNKSDDMDDAPQS